MTGGGVGGVPTALDGDAEDFAIHGEGFGGVGGDAVEPPDAGMAFLEEDRLGEPFTEAGGFADASGTDKNVGAVGGTARAVGGRTPEAKE